MLSETFPAELAQGIIQEIGEIERNEGARVVVSTPQGIVRARVAFSCLVKPACGDTVLVAQRGDAVYVLSVLERSVAGSVEIALQGAVSMAVDGNLTVRASEGLTLDGGPHARLRADAVEVAGDAIALAGNRVHIAARVLNWLADALESSARIVKQASDMWTVQARAHHRQVDELEMVRVGNMDMRSKNLINVASCHTIMKSRELTKIDGKQIQVG